jgi:hypothetical protein
MDDAELIERGHRAFAERARIGALGDGGEVSEGDGLLVWASGSTDFPVLVNGALPLNGLDDPERAVAQAHSFFASLGRGYTFVVRGLPDRDREWETAIQVAGIPLGLPRHPVMVCRRRLVERDSPAGAELRAVRDEASFEDFQRVLAGSFPSLGFPERAVRGVLTPQYVLRPDADAWVAYLDGAPAAAAMVIVSHGIAGLVWVGTVEAARGRGLAEACTRAATNSGFDRGAEAAWLEASFMGEPTYLRMGYEHLFAYKLYVSPPDA